MRETPQPTARPFLSVVFPLLDERGLGERAVRGWLDQTEPVEIIILSDGSTPRLDRRIRSLLRPFDRFTAEPGAGEARLYDRGGRAASGELLLLTESHCIPEPDAAGRLFRFFAESGASAAWLTTGHVADNSFARMETRLGEEERACRRDENDWRHVSLRGFALRRTLFLDAGGLPEEYGRFAEAVLAARIQRVGHGIRSVPGKLVRHGNCHSFSELSDALRGYASGQAAYWRRQETGAAEQLHPSPAEWTGRTALDPSVARALCAMAVRSLAADVGRPGWRARSAEALRELARRLPAALSGPRSAQLAARLRTLWAYAGCLATAWNDDRLYVNYKRLWSALVRAGVLEYICRNSDTLARRAVSGPKVSVGNVEDGRLTGFHARQDWATEGCRWSGPIALVAIDMPPGSYRVRLRGHSPFPEEVASVRIFFNGRGVPQSEVRRDAEGLAFAVSPKMFARGRTQTIGLVCRPLVPSQEGSPDSRRLGFLLISISFDAVPATGAVERVEAGGRRGVPAAKPIG